MAPSIGQVAGDDLKAQLNEYHLLVAEVLGGVTAQLAEHAQRLAATEKQLASMRLEIAALQELQSGSHSKRQKD